MRLPDGLEWSFEIKFDGYRAITAEIFGTGHGIVHDTRHRPVQNAMVDLKAQHSDWVQHQKTNGGGEFDFGAVPLGECTVMVTLTNFQQPQQSVRR